MIVRIPLKRNTIYPVFTRSSHGTSFLRTSREFDAVASESSVVTVRLHTYTDCPGVKKPVKCATEEAMLIILLVVLLVLSLGSLPAWPYSRGWGYYPSGGLGIVVVILVILLLTGRL